MVSLHELQMLPVEARLARLSLVTADAASRVLAQSRIPASVQKCSLIGRIRLLPDYGPYPKAKHYLARPGDARYEI
jgi:hypothetical protein